MWKKHVATCSVALLIATTALAEPEIAIRDGNDLMSQQSTPAMARALDDRVPIGAIEDLSGGASVSIVSRDGKSGPAFLGQPIYDGDRVVVSDGSVIIATINEQSIRLDRGSTERIRLSDYPIENSGSRGLRLIKQIMIYTSGLIGRESPDEVMDDTPVNSLGIRG